MKQTTNYILLFSLLVSLKFNNNDTIKIGISLFITYIVYQLFKKDNIENFPESSCSPGVVIITDRCLGVIGRQHGPSGYDATCMDSPHIGEATCNCDTTNLWKTVQYPSPSGPDNYTPATAGVESRTYSPSSSKAGECFCDPYTGHTGDISSPCYASPYEGDITTCKEWYKIPGCPSERPNLKNAGQLMGASPDNYCCSSPDPEPSCSPSPCPPNSYCDSSTAPYCMCNEGYTGSPPHCSPSTPPVVPPLVGICVAPDQTGYGDGADTDGISSLNIPLNVGEQKQFTCKERSGFWNNIWIWKLKPDPVTYQCNTQGSPPDYMKDGEISKDETPCDQFSRWFILKLPIILLFIVGVLYLAATAVLWVKEEIQSRGSATLLSSDVQPQGHTATPGTQPSYQSLGLLGGSE